VLDFDDQLLPLRGRPAVNGVLVSAVVVDDQVYIELGRDFLVDPP
jgi:hypothetical protein